MVRLIFLTLLLITPTISAGINPPTLKWWGKGGGPYLMYGGYAGSPAVVDLNGDNRQEVIWADYMIYVVDGETGDPIWNVYSGHDRSYSGNQHSGNTYPAVVIADLKGDSKLEIITAHPGGIISVYNSDGYFYNSHWPVALDVNSEIRSLCVADMNNDGLFEILVGSVRTDDNDYDWYILKPDGRPFPGWPQRARVNSGHGTFNQNATVADLDDDGDLELIGLSDNFYIHALHDNGEHVLAGAFYNQEIWAKIPLWMDVESELRGWAEDGELQPKFYFSSSIVDDVNHDHIPDIITVSVIHERGENNTVSYAQYHTPVILQPDRTRFNHDGFDWRVFPVPENLAESRPFTDDWQIIKVCLPDPVTADLDNDGFKEILYPANDGKMHACWLDKTEHHNWPYHVTHSGEGIIRYATAPGIADLDNDGHPEVIFGSWTPRNSQKFGKLHILNWQGETLYEVEVPHSDRGWNGITSTPTLANIDGDPDLEIVVGTTWTGICAYDLPGTEQAKIIWQTGHVNFQRTSAVDFAGNYYSVDDNRSKPDRHLICRNYPNPFNGETSIQINLPADDFLQLTVFDVLGRKIAQLFDGNLDSGEYQFQFSSIQNGRALTSGVYLCRIQGTSFVSTLKMLLLE